jgi:hypothetical protein
MCHHLSTPMLQQILHITMAMRCCIVLEQNDAMLKQFWLLTVKSWPHFILQEHTLSYKLVWDGQIQVHFG